MKILVWAGCVGVVHKAPRWVGNKKRSSNVCDRTTIICRLVCACVFALDSISDCSRIAGPPTSSPCWSLDVLKLIWISRFHNGGCQLPTVYPNSFLLSIDFSTVCQINWLPAQTDIKWTPWHFECLSILLFFLFVCLPAASLASWKKMLSAVVWDKDKTLFLLHQVY